MGKRLWLDDTRKPPFGYDHWAKTALQAIAYLEAHEVEHCSLDHDLAEEHYPDGLVQDPKAPPIDRSKYKELTGYAVIEWMETHNRWVPDITIHTLSMRGSREMLAKLRKAAPDHVEFRRVKPRELG